MATVEVRNGYKYYGSKSKPNIILNNLNMNVQPGSIIWDFLVSTARQSNTAVIITTHYIEEAKQANCIGLMRNGILLAEDTPENIMLRYEVNSLEDAFLLLSQRQGNNDLTQLRSQEQHQLQAISSASQVIDSSQTTIEQEGEKSNIYKKKHNNKTLKGPIKALLYKNVIKMIRNPMMVAYVFLLPLLSLACFYLSVGKTVKGIKLGIVNTESTCGELDMVTAINLNDTCYLNNTSCHFIRTIASTDLIKPVIYHDLEEAHRDAKNSYITGYIHIPNNFSRAMEVRLEDGRVTDDDIVEQTILSTYLDMTGGQTVYYTQLKLIEHFRTFMKDILTDCNFPTKYETVPVDFHEPIYGSNDADFQEFMVPGIVLTMCFFINALASANIFIEERSEGVWDRTLIAGVSTNQLLWSHLFTEFIISAIQDVEVVLFCTFMFNSFNQGNMVVLVGLLFLVSIGGMFYGLLLSVFCRTHGEANYAATGSFYIMVLMCGCMWPLEGMPKFLQYFASFLPFTLPGLSARNIIEKGWQITNSGVYMGYLVIIAWIIIFYVLCLVGLKRKM